jgi:hypothetical protein
MSQTEMRDEIASLIAERDRLRAALEEIARIAPKPYVDTAIDIAKRALQVLPSEPSEHGGKLST